SGPAKTDSRRAVTRAPDDGAAMREPAQPGLHVAQRRLVRQPARHRRPGPLPLVLDDGEVAAILLFLAIELREHRVGAEAPGGEEAHEDLLAQRRRPPRATREPRAQRALATRRQAKEMARPRAA